MPASMSAKRCASQTLPTIRLIRITPSTRPLWSSAGICGERSQYSIVSSY